MKMHNQIKYKIYIIYITLTRTNVLAGITVYFKLNNNNETIISSFSLEKIDLNIVEDQISNSNSSNYISFKFDYDILPETYVFSGISGIQLNKAESIELISGKTDIFIGCYAGDTYNKTK